MNKNKIVWKDGIPCIDLDEQPVYLIPGPGIGPPIRGSWPEPPMFEFVVEFLQPDFTSLQNKREQEFFEELLKELEELFKR